MTEADQTMARYRLIEVWSLAKYESIQCMEVACPENERCVQYFMNNGMLATELYTPNIMWDTTNNVYCSQTLGDNNHGRLTLTFDGLRCI